MKLANQSDTKEYLQYLDLWLEKLPSKKISEISSSPSEIALISVDMIKGFCNFGPLASPRVNGIIKPVIELMKILWESGVDKFVLSQDTHEPDAIEFSAWPPHCIRGTEEAETISEIRELPFFDQILILEKNSIATGLNVALKQFVRENPEMKTYIVVGDCTDLCTYQLAMFLRLDANEHQVFRRVIVPANCVETYDFPVEEAIKVEAIPHPGDFLHAVFLNHLALNGVEIVAKLISD